MKRDVLKIMGEYTNDNVEVAKDLLDDLEDRKFAAELDKGFLEACLLQEEEYTAGQIDKIKELLNLSDEEASTLFFDENKVKHPDVLIDDQERPYVREAFDTFYNLCGAKDCTALDLLIANAIASIDHSVNYDLTM